MLSDGHKTRSLPYQEGQLSPSHKQNEQRKSLDHTKKSLVVLTSIQELNFPNFVSTDMSGFYAKVTGTRSRVISSTEYIVEIKISNIPTFQVYKSYTQFQAFYKALKLRFINVKWPDFPSKIALIKKVETRISGFNKILAKFFETMRIVSDYRISLLSLFYAFFLEQGLTENLRRDHKTSTKSEKIEQRTREDSDQEEDISHEDILKMSILDFEQEQMKKFSYELVEDRDSNRESIFSDISTEKLSPVSKRKGTDEPLKAQIESLKKARNSVPSKFSRKISNEENLLDLSNNLSIGSVEQKCKTISEPFNASKHKNSISMEEIKEENNNSTNTGSNEKNKKPRKLTKDFPEFSGLIYMKLSSSQRWNQYFARVNRSIISLYNNIMANHPNHLVVCYKCELNIKESPEGNYIELYHPYDNEKLYLTTSLEDQLLAGVEEGSQTLQEWYEHLSIAREDSTGLENIDENYSPVGKLQIVVSQASNLDKFPGNCFFYVKIHHSPFILKTSTTLADFDKIQWKQSFFIPIYDTFFPIKFEIYCRFNTGWLMESKTEEMICTGEVLVADIITSSTEDILTLNLPLTYTEVAKKLREETSNQTQKESIPPELYIKIKNLSSLKTLFHPSNTDYIEGIRVDPDTFSKQQLKLGISRVKRIWTACSAFITDIEDIFHSKYPFFSYVCILLMTHFVLTLDTPSLISLFFLILTLLCIYNHPRVQQKVSSFLNTYFFSDEHLNSDYHHPMVQTLEELLDKKEMQTEKWKYKLVDDDPILYQLKVAKQSVMVFASVLLKITGFFEKLKNIIMWHDPLRTLWFIGFTLLAYCVSSVMSFRFLFLFIIWANFIEGFSFYKTRYLYNLELTKEALNSLLKRHFPSVYQQVSGNLTQSWPVMSNFETFQKKMIKELGNRFQLNLADDAFQTFTSPHQLIVAIATCSKTLKYNSDPKEEITVETFKKTTAVDYSWKLVDFIMNVPSDFYRVLHPRKIDPYSSWRTAPLEQNVQKPKSKKREFEIMMIVGFITIYELYLLLNYFLNLNQEA